MNIIVCLKRVPDTETRVRFSDGSTVIEPEGIKYIVSPYDEFALEAAFRTTEMTEEGQVTVMTLGNEDSQETLRAALAAGADAAVLLRAQGAVTMDGLATAKALAAELETREEQVVLFGVKAGDDDQQQVGPMVATLLGRPCASNVTSFEVGEGVLRCHRDVEGGTEVVELDLPAVVTLTKGAFELRFASLKGIMAAKRKPLDVKDVDLPESRLSVERLDYPPERAEGWILGEGADAVPELVQLLRDEANVL
ncbi:MAG: electron transfer flavoprotein subunit beta/FixA family protein [Gemmatimonadota bacterium]|nr:electron transfer flavoprotein subunit beta/FixA family protein [Gemmatimonadota bacterium]